MYRKFIATIAAASIAITAISATSAAAGDRERDLAKIAAGVLGVAIIGKIISDNNKRNDNRGQVVTRHRVDPVPVYRAPQVQHRQHKLQPRPLPRGYGHQRGHVRGNDKLLPKQCFQSFDTRRGSVLMFGSRCLQHNYRHANRLPQHCAQQIRTRQGTQFGYDARCLRGAGYSLARG
jgi:hypothetical protein